MTFHRKNFHEEVYGIFFFASSCGYPYSNDLMFLVSFSGDSIFSQALRAMLSNKSGATTGVPITFNFSVSIN